MNNVPNPGITPNMNSLKPNDLLNTNRFIPNSNTSLTTHNRKPLSNPFLTNSSQNGERVRTTNVGLNHSVEHNAFINDATHVIIDSRNRNHEKYPLPNNYKIETNKPFSNIKEITLVDINIINSIPPVNLHNNNIIWEYPTLNEAGKITNIFLPTDNLTNNKIYLGTNLPEGFYNTTDIITMLETSLNNIKHKNEFLNVVNGTSHKFYVSIDETTHLVKIINRLEELPIYALQTFLDPTEDVLLPFQIGPPPIISGSNDSFFITIRKEFVSETFPLVITDAVQVDDINISQIDCQTYFEESLSQNYQYELYDQLDINGVIYYRYKMTPPNLIVETSENIIFSKAGGHLDKTLCASMPPLLNFILNTTDKPLVGRALPFRLFYQRSQITNGLLEAGLDPINIDGSIKTILELLAWNVKNNDIGSVNTALYQYIQTNKDSFLLPETSFSATVNGYEYSMQNRLLNIENNIVGYPFRSDDYIFLRILLNQDHSEEIGTQIILAGSIETPVNDNDKIHYNVAPNAHVPASQKIHKKNTNNIFAKIDLNNIPGNTTSSISNSIPNNVHYKNEQLDELRELTIQFFDRQGRLLNLRTDHHFVLEIITKRNILENILVNTQTG